MMSIPTDLRQFNVGTVLLITTTIAVSACLTKFAPLYPLIFLTSATTFWLGMGLLALSDWVDPSPIEDRRLSSSILNAVGVIGLSVSFIAWCGTLILNLFALVASYQ